MKRNAARAGRPRVRTTANFLLPLPVGGTPNPLEIAARPAAFSTESYFGCSEIFDCTISLFSTMLARNVSQIDVLRPLSGRISQYLAQGPHLSQRQPPAGFLKPGVDDTKPLGKPRLAVGTGHLSISALVY